MSHRRSNRKRYEEKHTAADALTALLYERAEAALEGSEQSRLAGEQKLASVQADRDRLAAELAQVKQCRDEYGDEIDVANARAERVEAKLEAVKAALYASDYEPSNRIWHEQMQRLRAILADTDETKDSIAFNTDDLGPATDIDGNPLADIDEGKADWVCSKCAREAVRGYDDGQIPEHHRTCQKRVTDTDERSGR